MVTTDLTAQLKFDLQRYFGTKEHPSEWDSNDTHGGGMYSQRYWEYFKAIEYADFTEESVVLDIGGGTDSDHLGFFSSLLYPHVKEVIVLDQSISPRVNAPGNVSFIRENADRGQLIKVLHNTKFGDDEKITHIMCISVLEHIEQGMRKEMFSALDEQFIGESFITTFEYHPQECFFEHQLTTKSLSDMVSDLSNLYLDRFEACPVYSENAFSEDERCWDEGNPRLIIPLWYPLALKFKRLNNDLAS